MESGESFGSAARLCSRRRRASPSAVRGLGLAASASSRYIAGTQPGGVVVGHGGSHGHDGVGSVGEQLPGDGGEGSLALLRAFLRGGFCGGPSLPEGGGAAGEHDHWGLFSCGDGLLQEPQAKHLAPVLGLAPGGVSVVVGGVVGEEGWPVR